MPPSAEAPAVASTPRHDDDLLARGDDDRCGGSDDAAAATSSSGPGVERFGHYCRAFYSASISTTAVGASGGRCRTRGGDDDGRAGKAVMEALDLICRRAGDADAATSTGGQPRNAEKALLRSEYASFLSRTASSGSTAAALGECGLGNVDEALSLISDATIREKYARARDEARRGAHSHSMNERDTGLRRALEEARQARHINWTGGAGAAGGAATTRKEVHATRTRIRRFVSHHKSSLGAHPLLAGLRRLLERQLEEGSKLERWTFDGAVITEGCKVQTCGGGGSDAYVRDTVDVLASFLVWISPEEKDEEDKTKDLVTGESPKKWRGTFTHTNSSTTSGHSDSDDGSVDLALSTYITFYVQPHLSDRTLRKLLEVLPRAKELHARPTGSLEVAAAVTRGSVRTNVNGELDEQDLCHEVMENVMGSFGRLKLFSSCPS